KFGANMTTLTFHVSRSIGAALAPGDEIVVTRLYHEANIGPWQAIAADRGLVLRTVDVHVEDGTLDLDDLDRVLSSRTRLLAVGYASNALGTINPLATIVSRAHAVGAWVYVDAVHFAPHGPIDVQALDVEFLVCSAYKFFGPHVGVLYGRAGILEQLPAYKVRPASDRFETGTGNFEGIAGAMAAVDYLAWVGERFGVDDAASFPAFRGRALALKCALSTIRRYEMSLFERLRDGLVGLPGVRLWGIGERHRFAERVPTAALTLPGIGPRAAAEALGEDGIAAWDGHFYAQGLIERLGLADAGGLLRIGLVHYNTDEEVDRLLGALDRVIESAGAVAGSRA
ncbi:MAG TPA: cysteine desulfurase-like protein, partial [Candidatus Limnocylindrales bacterium]